MKRFIFIVVVGVILFPLASNILASIEKPNLNEYYHLGKYYASTKQYREGIANYRAMIGKHPNTRQAEEGWLTMGSCYYHLMLEARAELKKAKERIGTTAHEIKRLEANVRSYMNDAIASYKKVIGQFPNKKAEAIIAIGRTYADSGLEKAAKARLQFQKVIDNYPEEAARAQILLGDSYVNGGNLEVARQMYSIAQASFPEVASLAKLKRAGCYFDAQNFSRASDGYQVIIDYMGINGAYRSYHPIGDVMSKAIAKRGEAERALNNIENELNGYRAVISRFPETNVCMGAKLELAEAYWFNNQKGEAVKLLRGIASQYPKSIWKVKALLLLAKLQGSSQDAVITYKEITDSFRHSRVWIKAKMKVAKAYRDMAEEEKDPVEKDKLKGKVRNACNAVISAYSFCPEANEARDFLKKNSR